MLLKLFNLVRPTFFAWAAFPKGGLILGGPEQRSWHLVIDKNRRDLFLSWGGLVI